MDFVRNKLFVATTTCSHTFATAVGRFGFAMGSLDGVCDAKILYYYRKQN